VQDIFLASLSGY